MSELLSTGLRDSVENLRTNVMDVFDKFLPAGIRREGLSDDPLGSSGLFARGGPAVDVDEDNDAIHVSAELPGLDEKDFSVEVLENRLILKGEKKSEREEEQGKCYYSERRFGSFTRVIPLPCEIDSGKVTAKYKNGVLSVSLPKTQALKTKRVKVEVV